ncbi:MAG: DUF4160 domain-containing protein [Lachnospiraceae bacterium]|nr:DUF4160 domain-containing protein [Lachnospiraceae bacterium]
MVKKAFGYHIFFWSNEGEPLEPLHFHISEKPHKNSTKVWILRDGSLKTANNNDNIPANDLKRIIRFMSLEGNVENTRKKWLEHFGEIKYYA